jgi:hypothetical protein
LVGANKKDDYYIASHFEVVDKTGNKLVEYVRRGTPLDEQTKSFIAKAVLQEFDTFFTMFLGILWTDTKKLFIGRAEDELQINPIVSHSDFYQTNLLLPKLKAFAEPLRSVLHEQDFATLWKQIEHFFAITETITKVQRKMFGQNGSDFYFLFSEEARYTNRDEFKDIFQKNHIVFLSDHEKNYSPVIVKTETDEVHKKLLHINTL